MIKHMKMYEEEEDEGEIITVEHEDVLDVESAEHLEVDDVDPDVDLDDIDEDLDVEHQEGEMCCSVSDGSAREVTVGSPREVSLRSSSPAGALILPSDSPHSSSESSAVSTGSVSGNVRAPIEKRHICNICSKAFPYLSILESHKRCHTGEKPFNCHFCDKKFAQKATLQVHERTHTGERPYKCRYCEKTFAQYGTKTVHEKSAHLGIRNYKCPLCEKCLSSPSALYTHKKTHGEKVFACQFCPKTFTLKNYLKLHVRQVHEQNEKKHVCKFCAKSFAYAGSLQVHVRTHTGERPYSCRFCPKAFASQGNLQSHERTHTGERPYSCRMCGRSFIQKSQLTAHEATHSSSSTTGDVLDNKPSMNDCKMCDRRFTNQGNLLVHQRVHTGLKPYSCSGCGKSYSQKVGLQIHQEQCSGCVGVGAGTLGAALGVGNGTLGLGSGVFRAAGLNTTSPLIDTDSDSSVADSRRNSFAIPNIYINTSPTSLSTTAFSSCNTAFNSIQPQTPLKTEIPNLDWSSLNVPALTSAFQPLSKTIENPLDPNLLKTLLENCLLQQNLLTGIIGSPLGRLSTDLASLLSQQTPALPQTSLPSIPTSLLGTWLPQTVPQTPVLNQIPFDLNVKQESMWA